MTRGAPVASVDLLGGASATSYPVSYLDEQLESGFNTEAYKTTNLVLRCIGPGTFQMCGQHQTTLTKPYYIGIFELAQKQYELVMGSNPSAYTGDMRPVENMSYNTIRGSLNGAAWPASNAVDSTSFLGKLRARTGLNFDLPTEAQWEYACRAGTTSLYPKKIRALRVRPIPADEPSVWLRVLCALRVFFRQTSRQSDSAYSALFA